MLRSAFISTVSALALFAAGHAAAQDAAPQAAPLRIGQSVDAQLTEQDARIDDEEIGQFVYDNYSIQTRAGQRLQAVLRSDDFDAFLEIYRGDDSGEPVVSDDDGLGQGTGSRARFTAEGGTYIVRARTLYGLEGGDYALEVTDRGPAPRAPRPTAIRLGQRISGELTDRDPIEEDGDFWEYGYHSYSFRARQGERVAIGLDSDDFDAKLRVGRVGRNGAFETLAENDDSGSGGLNSYLVFTAPSSGEFIIRASSYGGSDEGDYQLRLEQAPAPLPAQPVAFGDTVQGELSDSDGLNQHGQRADAYAFNGRAGQRIVATMNSDAFDAYLELFSENDSGEPLDYDDDGGAEGMNARLTYTLPSDGRYRIEARGYSGSARGAYTFSLNEAAPMPAPTPLSFGATVEGELVADDPRDDDDRPFDAYSFTGTAGNRVQLIMRSGDFDTYLQIGEPEGEFSVLASDDDGLGEGTNSRLNYILPSDGPFIVRALPYYGESNGLYSLELIDRGPQPLPGSILVGATARGTLSEEDAIADDGAFYDAYRISVKAGDRLRVTMISNAFDAYLDIGRGDDSDFSSVASDDDSLSDTHAKVEWTVEDAGDYVIRARSYASGSTGDYVLTVEPRE